MSADDGPGTREVARRLFAAEYEDTTLSYSESDEERAPNYVVTPTGGRVNRLFVVGVLTEVESVNEEMLRARLVDPSGAFVAYAGQYQPDALAFFERHDPPEFVALSGKARTFQPEDSEQVFTSVRPESANAVDADTRDRWVISAAEATLRRVSQFEAAAESGLSGEALTEALRAAGVDESLAAGIPRAMEHYGTTTAYLEAVRRLAVDALEVVAGEREEVRPLDVAPDEGGEASLGPVPDRLAAAPLEAPLAAAESGESSEPDVATDEAEFEDEETSVPIESTDDDGSTEPTEEASEPEPAEATTDENETGGLGVTEPEEADSTEPETSADAGEGDDADAEAGAGGLGLNESEPAGEFSEAHAGEEELGDEDEASADSDEAPDGIDEGSDLGDFDAGADDDPDEAEGDIDTDEMYELDEEERREVEEEFDVGFESGAEVGDPGEAGIETPDPEDLAEAEATAADAAADAPAEAEVGGTEPAAEPAPEPDAEVGSSDDAADTGDEDEEAAADVDLEDAAVAAMADLDEGDGAERQEVVAVVVDEHGADPGAVEDAIQEALMDGQCYEPGDGRLKAI
jgi:RPA family protein